MVGRCVWGLLQGELAAESRVDTRSELVKNGG